MVDLKWSDSEKRLSRRVYDAALKAKLANIMAAFKAKALAVTMPPEMYALQDFLHQQSRVIDDKYDYRYCRLIGVFGRLIREGRVSEAQLKRLTEEKLAFIRYIDSS